MFDAGNRRSDRCWQHHGGMRAVDADLIDAWFAAANDAVWHPANTPIPGTARHLRISASPAELRALTLGHSAVRAAVTDGQMPVGGSALDDDVAANLLRYLLGVASGIAGAGSPASVLSLVAGLLTGAAAIGYDPTNGEQLHGRTGSAAQAAGSAAVGAADLAGDGADLHRVASSAAADVILGMVLPPPEDPGSAAHHRLRVLIGLLLAGLEHASRPVSASRAPASCGAGPGENAGREFLAEVTFQVFADAAMAAELAAALVAIADDVRVWPDGPAHRFHLHTVQAGEAIARAYAHGLLFDLRVSSLQD